MTLKAIPKSRAKTGWGLCAAVIRAIQAEPKRANMHVITDEESPEFGGPKCGTVGCFAGWVCLLAKGGEAGIKATHTGEARAILGPDVDYHIVGSGGQYVFNTGGGDACATTQPGTRDHARAVVKRIRRFMRVNKAALKARKLAGVRR